MIWTALRAFLFSIPRHLVIFIAVIALSQFEWSPLPEWTMIPVMLILQFLITFFFAEWTLIRHTPSKWDALLVFLIFLVFGTLWEGMFMVYIGGGEWSQILRSYSWGSLWIIAIYACAVAAATYRVRRKKIQATLPEGLEH